MQTFSTAKLPKHKHCPLKTNVSKVLSATKKMDGKYPLL